VQVVVADSGSTDGTLSICETAGVRTLYVPPGNMYRGVNAGLRAVDSPWLTYLNGDDFVYTDAYSTLIDAGEHSGADLVYGDCDYTDWHGRFIYCMRAPAPEVVRKVYRVGLMPFNQPCAVFRKTLFERLDGFDETYRYLADLDFFTRAARLNATFHQVRNYAVTAFRLHPGQATARERALNEAERVQIVKSHGGTPGFAERLAPWQWRLGNASQYLIRRIRTGQWKGRPPSADMQPGERNRNGRGDGK
jgi:glycosyltransferase involved in cell wall biosynthesis